MMHYLDIIKKIKALKRYRLAENRNLHIIHPSELSVNYFEMFISGLHSRRYSI